MWQRHGKAWALLALVVALQVVLIAQTPWDWWFEDDAPHRVFVRDHANPLAYFGPTLVAKLSLGHSVTPWFPFTFWLDHQMSATSPLPAYLHTGFSLWLTACALYVLTSRFLGRRGALVVASLWVFLPSTVVITEFLSCRHYLEGLLFSSFGLWCAFRALESQAPWRLRFTLFSLLAYLLACTTKEVYVSALWFMLLALYLNRRYLLGIAGTVLCGILYAVYRLVSLGLVGKSMGSDFAQRYYLFPQRWPFMLVGHEGGYLLVALLAVVVIVLLVQRSLSWRSIAFLIGTLGVMVLTIFPVSAPVTDQFRDLGTWYRVVFLLNTFALFAGSWLVMRLERPALSRAMAVLLALCAIYGGWQTTRRWDTTKATYTSDANFYLDHPDRLLYSDLPAPWFIYGVHHLYLPEQPKHYITWRVDGATSADYVLEQVQNYDTIWRKRDGQYVSEPELLGVIEENCRQDITPLDQLPETSE